MTLQNNAEKYVCLDCGAIVDKKDMIIFPAALACLKHNNGAYIIPHQRICKNCACNELQALGGLMDLNSVAAYEQYNPKNEFRQFITEYFNEKSPTDEICLKNRLLTIINTTTIVEFRIESPFSDNYPHTLTVKFFPKETK
jgi:hypothetical protein